MPPIIGPLELVTASNGEQIPFYVIRFDKEGQCTSPSSREHLLANVGEATHLFLFSHGWNNDWDYAVGRYRHFIQGLTESAAEHPGVLPETFRPILVGVKWPSTALVAPWEGGPQIGGGSEDKGLDAIADELDPENAALWRRLLASQAPISEADAQALATLVATKIAAGNEDLDAVADEVLSALIRSAKPPLSEEEEDEEDDEIRTTNDGEEEVQAGGFWERLDPRNLIRGATVLQMKDRAGRMGATGVGALLRDMLGQSDAPLYALGHSYGCRVLLSAICIEELPRPVRGLVLLQPAVNHLCFAADVDGRPGGYRPAFARVELPIRATWSRDDSALRKFFHLAARRARDVGEINIAGVPTRYAALGGFGPAGVRAHQMTMPPHGTPYPDTDRQVMSIDSTGSITDHGDISNKFTWWTLLDLVGR